MLVVCTANIARSPLAEVLLRGYVRAAGADDEVVVASAGVRARPGLPAADSSVEIARAWGLDLSGHRSQPVTDDLLVGSDLIVTMSVRQRDLLGPRAPRLARKLFTLGELSRLVTAVEVEDLGPGTPGERLRVLAGRAHDQRPLSAPPDEGEDVADPFGGPHDGYVVMANELLRLLEPITTPVFGR